LVLLHFKDGKSLIDDPSFFLSPEGKKNPYKELQATIRAINRNPYLRCKFPARAFFIEKFLKINLPKVKCPELDKFLEEIKGEKISLIFADYYINSPASMFGHTFLRIYDREKNVYSFIVNYAAQVNDTNALIYAFKGLFGFYKGYYYISPYYQKIKEYVGIEGRDLWEYELKVDREMLLLLKLHLWELKDKYSHYYFFHKNCSSEILYLLGILKPNNSPHVRTPWVIPIDTIRAVLDKNLVRKINYYPSLLTQLRYLSKHLKDDDVEKVINWAFDKSELPKNGSAFLYEFAAQYVKFLYYSKDIDRRKYIKKYLYALKLRSKGGKINYSIKPEGYPHVSHRSQRFSITYGFNKVTQYMDVSYRPAYHDLLDPPQGYKKNGEIVFSEISLRFLPKLHRFTIQDWKILRIISLEPMYSFYRPISWKVDFGFHEFLNDRGEKRKFLSITSGFGFSIGEKITSFSLGEIKVMHNFDGEMPIAVGLRIGLLKQGKIFSFISSISSGKYLKEFNEKYFFDYSLRFAFHINRSLSVRFKTNYQLVGNKASFEPSVSALIYF